MKNLELQGNGHSPHNTNIISHCETPSANPLNLPISYITSHSIIEDSSPSQTNIVILRNGVHNLRLIDILSKQLEDKFTNCSKTFKNDEAINPFMQKISTRYDHIMYCGSSEAQVIVYNRSFNRLWYRQYLSRVKIVLIPFNINLHWILIALDLNERIIYILDPLTNGLDIHSENITNSITIGSSILQHIFSRGGGGGAR